MMAILWKLLTLIIGIGLCNQCHYEWDKIFKSQITVQENAKYQKMFENSGFFLNNLGNFEACTEVESAKYAVTILKLYPTVIRTYCGPEICDEKDYFDLKIPFLDMKSEKAFNVFFPKQYQDQNYSILSSGARITISVILIIAIFSFFGTILDYFTLNSTIFSKFFICFSLKTNLSLLFSKKTSEKTIFKAFDGLRVINILWIILGHTSALFAFSSININKNIFHDMSSFWLILPHFSIYSVDIFFWLSGFLMSFNLIPQFSDSNHLTLKQILAIVFHRVLRILPTYAFCFCLAYFIKPFLFSGPMWIGSPDFSMPDCKDYWYTNFIFLSNFLPIGKGNMCFGVGWFLSADMQFFVITIFLSIFYAKISRNLAYFITFLLCLGNCLSAWVIGKNYEINPVNLAFKYNQITLHQYHINSFTRIAPYAYGVICGFIIYSQKKSEKNQQDCDKISQICVGALKNKYFKNFSIIIAGSMLTFNYYFIYSSLKRPGINADYDFYDRESINLYFILEKNFGGIGFSLIFLQILLGKFKTLEKILSFSFWKFFSDLTFIVYLIHFYVIQVFLKAQQKEIIITPEFIYKESLFYMVLCFFIAIPIKLMVELPFINFERLLVTKKSSILKQVEIEMMKLENK